MNICPGTRIKELRRIYGMSQEELGRRVGVQRAAINKYENGTVTNIPIHTIEKIAQTFEVSPTYIVGWDEIAYNPLAAEVKLLKGIQHIYGKEVVDLLETYFELSKVGKDRVHQYIEDIWVAHKNI